MDSIYSFVMQNIVKIDNIAFLQNPPKLSKNLRYCAAINHFDRVWAIFSIFGIIAFVKKSRLDMVFRYEYDFSSTCILGSHAWLIFISCKKTSIHSFEFRRDWPKKKKSDEWYLWEHHMLRMNSFYYVVFQKTTKIESFAILQDSQKSAKNCVMC